MIKRYDLYCAYINRDPQCEILQVSTGKYVEWHDHNTMLNKLKNCWNCKNKTTAITECKLCTDYNNWEM